MPIHHALAAFLADPRNTVRRPPSHVPMEKVRAAANAAMGGWTGPAVAQLRAVDLQDDGSRWLRLYQPTHASNFPVVLFLHGGGWVWGDLDTHDAVCRLLAVESGACVAALDYRLAPEHRHPCQLDDIRAAVAWLDTQSGNTGFDGRLALCGDSAGAYLALAACLDWPPDREKPTALGLFYPPLDPNCDSPSQLELADGHMLTRDAMMWFWECFLGAERDEPAPHLKGDLSTLPPTLVTVAEFDILRDEGAKLAAMLRAASVPVDLRCAEGMLHGFLSLAPAEDVARAEIRAMASHFHAAFEKGRP